MKPHITEKSYQLATTKTPVFTFNVAKGDGASFVKMTIKEMYGKDVIDVRFLRNAAKKVKRQGVSGVKSSRRKVLVTLKEGQRIKEFDIETKETKETKKDKKTKE